MVTGEGKQVDPAEVGAVRKQACAHLAKFPGKTRVIGGRQYLRFEDYRSWKGPKAKGGLKARKGFLTASWNALDDDDATIAGVLLQELDHGLDWRRWVPASGLEEQLRSRRELVDGLRGWSKKDDKDAELVEDWRHAAQQFLGELLAYQEAVARIEKRYVDGIPLLFPDVARNLDQVIEGMETLVGIYNDLLAKHGPAAAIDLGVCGKMP